MSRESDLSRKVRGVKVNGQPLPPGIQDDIIIEAHAHGKAGIKGEEANAFIREVIMRNMPGAHREHFTPAPDRPGWGVRVLQALVVVMGSLLVVAKCTGTLLP